MAGITREEFHNFYEESLLPRLEKYEIIRQNNIKVLPKTDKAKSEIFLVFLIFISAILITLILYKTDYSAISKTLSSFSKTSWAIFSNFGELLRS